MNKLNQLLLTVVLFELIIGIFYFIDRDVKNNNIERSKQVTRDVYRRELFNCVSFFNKNGTTDQQVQGLTKECYDKFYARLHAQAL